MATLSTLLLAGAGPAANTEGPARARATTPIACRLDAFDAEELAQHAALTKAVRGDIQEVRELPNGYALRLPTDSKCFAEAAAWIALERRCCPFFDFQLSWHGTDEAPWLRLTGPPAAKAMIRDGLLAKS